MNRKQQKQHKQQGKRKSLKDLRLQQKLHLTDEDISDMRFLAAIWSNETEEFIPSTLPLVELVRLMIDYSIQSWLEAT
jgi:hypothetical protein